MSILALALSISLSTASPNYGPQPTEATKTELMQLRAEAWQSWFGNDEKRFTRVVPDELVAMGWGGGAWADRSESLNQMREFAAGGKKLTALEFPQNVFQQYGDVVILYTRFKLTMTDPTGTSEHLAGRGTEVFVKRKKRWIHTGWHLDLVAQ